MLERIMRGLVPEKHHIALRGDQGKLLYEQCLTRQGFDGPYTISYHLHRPHALTSEGAVPGFDRPMNPAVQAESPPRRRHFKTPELSRRPSGALEARRPLLFNEDLTLSVLLPDRSDESYFSNADGDELYFVHQGGGNLRTPLGDLEFTTGDYLLIPRGTLHRFILSESDAQHWLLLECHGGVGVLPEWLNAHGQLRMGAPYSHRDFKKPEFRGPLDEGIRRLLVKRQGRLFSFGLQHSPLDVVGYDGSVYPWVFPISRFQPKVGQVHLPPTVHGTFAARGALICSFVPRPVDFHPAAVPCPYPHASVDVDEVLFYVEGHFTSRRGIARGSISLHPAGIPHGPHPGAYEDSLGTRETSELAIMVDCYRPLSITDHALGIEDAGYDESFR